MKSLKLLFRAYGGNNSTSKMKESQNAMMLGGVLSLNLLLHPVPFLSDITIFRRVFVFCKLL